MTKVPQGATRFQHDRNKTSLFTSSTASFLALLLVFPPPAYAAVESVTPVSLWCADYFVYGTSYWLPDLCIFPTDLAAAQHEAAAYTSINAINAARYAAINNTTPILVIMSITSCNGQGACTYSTSENGIVTQSGPYMKIWNKYPACPAPTTNPTIPYQYSYSSGMCERNAQELLITLSGDTNTTEPWHKKHDPEHLKANLIYKAIVKDQNGQLKAGTNVTIITDVTSDSGGHIHTNGRPKGKLVAGAVTSTKSGTESITGKTNGSGVFEFTFGAEEASGTHTLTAKCDSGCQAPATSTVDVKVEGLVPIPDVTYINNPDASFYTLIDTDGTVIGATSDKHKANHYLTPDASTILLYMASSYHAEVKYWTKPSNGKKSVPPLPLYLNDASLVWGGVFDINGDWKVDHIEHRRGTVIDIRANSKTGAIPSRNFEKFIKLAKYYGVHAKIHSPDSDNQHFHVRLLNREE